MAHCCAMDLCGSLTTFASGPWLRQRPQSLRHSCTRDFDSIGSSTTPLPCLTGSPINVVFRTKINRKQQAWLQATAVALRSISFRRGEPASHVIIAPVRSVSVQRPCDRVPLDVQVMSEVRTDNSMSTLSIYT